MPSENQFPKIIHYAINVGVLATAQRGGGRENNKKRRPDRPLRKPRGRGPADGTMAEADLLFASR